MGKRIRSKRYVTSVALLSRKWKDVPHCWNNERFGYVDGTNICMNRWRMTKSQILSSRIVHAKESRFVATLPVVGYTQIVHALQESIISQGDV